MTNKRVHGSTYYFLDAPSKCSPVMDWFKGLAFQADQYELLEGYNLLFKSMIPDKLVEGQFEARDLPLVSVALPQVRRGIIWTIGEVRFVNTRLRNTYPDLDKIRNRFKNWLRSHPCVYNSTGAADFEYSYFLEGSSRNWTDEIRALPRGLAAIQAEQYFVNFGDNEHVIDKLCRSLRLRGVDCQPPRT